MICLPFRAYAERLKTDYLFVVDADARIDHPHVLLELLRQNR